MPVFVYLFAFGFAVLTHYTHLLITMNKPIYFVATTKCRHLSQFNETFWKGVHALRLIDLPKPEVYPTVYVAAQHRPPTRRSYG